MSTKTTKTTTTAPINPADVRAVEYALSLRAGDRTHFGTLVEGTDTLGLAWPAHVAETVTQCAGILRRATQLEAKRPRLTWEDASAEDMETRVVDAITRDANAARTGTPAQTEIMVATVQHMTETFDAAIPEMIEKVADWIEAHAEIRHLADAAASLPERMRGEIGLWTVALDVHRRLLERSDRMGWSDLERNDVAHIVYDWTAEQWAAFHAEHPTLKGSDVAPFKTWRDLADVAVKPVRSVEELAERTTRHNDEAEAIDKGNAPRQGFDVAAHA
ncbi:hypothetical protein [Brachybacterium huguangmaarense]